MLWQCSRNQLGVALRGLLFGLLVFMTLAAAVVLYMADAAADVILDVIVAVITAVAPSP
jgi:tetrahydromethanopterin S-methyltransferase subunit E